MKIGTTDIDKCYVGTTEIEKIYLGTTSIYEKSVPSDLNTLFLLHFDEDLRDSSVSQCDVTNNPSYTLMNNGKFDKAFQKIGYYGNQAYWYTKYGQTFDVTDAYTIEYWTYINTNQTYNSKGYLELPSLWYSWVTTGSGAAILNWRGHPTTGSATITSYITDNSWNHICFQFVHHDFCRIYVNGVIVQNYDTYAASEYYLPTPMNYAHTEGNITYTDGCQMLLDELRLSNIARYDKDGFTVPDKPFPSYDPASYHSKLKNCIEVGTLTENNYVYSGFNPSNFISVTNPLNPANKTWEVKMKFTTGSNVNDYQALFHAGWARTDAGRYGIGFAITGNKFNFFNSNTGSSWLVAENTSEIVNSNTDYWVKFGFTGSLYYFDYSTNGSDYTRPISVSSTLGTYSPLIFTNIGAYQRTLVQQCFTGSIDMSQTSITVDGVTTNFI